MCVLLLLLVIMNCFGVLCLISDSHRVIITEVSWAGPHIATHTTTHFITLTLTVILSLTLTVLPLTLSFFTWTTLIAWLILTVLHRIWQC